MNEIIMFPFPSLKMILLSTVSYISPKYLLKLFDVVHSHTGQRERNTPVSFWSITLLNEPQRRDERTVERASNYFSHVT